MINTSPLIVGLDFYDRITAKVTELGGIKLDICTDWQIVRQSEATNHAIEDGSIISDHVNQLPIEISISCVLFTTFAQSSILKSDKLIELWTKKERVSLELSNGRKIDSLVITNLTESKSNTDSDTDAQYFNITLQQVKVVQLNKRQAAAGDTNQSDSERKKNGETKKKGKTPNKKIPSKEGANQVGKQPAPQKTSGLFDIFGRV